MSLSDPIGDMLTRMRNAIRAGHPTVKMPSSRVKARICDVLKAEGYIVDFQVDQDGARSALNIALKYTGNREPVIRNMRRVSKPSLRRYSGSTEMKQVRSGLGISIVSTSRGIMTGRQARAANLGGEVLCEVW